MSKFGDAFAAARKAGKKTFKFGGKLYTTKMKSESKVPVPSPRPDSTKTGSINKPASSGKPAPGIPTPTRKPSNPAATNAINEATRASVAAQNAAIRAQTEKAKLRIAGLKKKPNA